LTDEELSGTILAVPCLFFTTEIGEEKLCLVVTVERVLLLTDPKEKKWEIVADIQLSDITEVVLFDPEVQSCCLAIFRINQEVEEG
jgi:hypothetical protein